MRLWRVLGFGFGFLLAVLAVGGAILAAIPSARRGAEAAAVTVDILSGGGTRLLALLSGPPRRRPVSWAGGAQRRDGDLYEPSAPRRAALVLVPGLARAGKDHPRLVAFAETLARARFRVLVPDLRSVRALRVTAGNVREIAEAAIFLAEGEPAAGGRDAGPLGIVAFSYGVAPALLAAIEPDLAPRLDFLVAIGGYYDAEAVIAFVTTGAYREGPDAAWRRAVPNPAGKWLFALSNAPRLNAPADREILRRLARRALVEPEADLGALAARLGPEGRAVYALLRNRDPDRVPELIESLPAAIRGDIAALDPRRHDLSRLRARLLLVHGRTDPVIPYTETLALAAAVPEGQAEVFLVEGLNHVSPGIEGLADLGRMWRAVYRLLDLADGRRRGGEG